MRAAIYTRISLDQNGDRLGVERQRKECLALAERLGWEVVAEHDDNDRSAYSGRRRPGFEALLEQMKSDDAQRLRSSSRMGANSKCRWSIRRITTLAGRKDPA